MTSAAEWVAGLHRRGVALRVDGDRLGIRPAGALTAEERISLSVLKREVLAVLRGLHDTTGHDTWADDVPDGPCGLCGSPLAWVEDWPAAGSSAWLCAHCAAFPAPTLALVLQNLTENERERLRAECADGDALAVIVAAESGYETTVSETQE